MILLTVKIAKIIVLTAALAGGYYMFRKSLGRKTLLGLAVVMVLFSMAANMISGHLPPLTDEVTLTALGERSETAQVPEIVAEGFVVDGQAYPIGKVAEGKWYWRGDQYMWRLETDTRQPEGTTRSVTLKVPVGWSRSIRFSSNDYRGIVELTTESKTEKIDTAVTSSAEIGRSNSSVLVLNYLIVLMVYTLVFLAMSGVLLWAVRCWIRYPQKTSQFWQEHQFHAALAGICAAAFAVMLKLCGQESFWQDEFALIHYITQTDSIVTAMLTDIAWPPLWKGIMFIWYRLVPYGDKWLMLMPELCYLPGIYFTGLCGKELFNRRVGILAAIAAAASPRLIIRAASDLTCYSFLFSLSAIILYLYIKWTWKEQRCWRDAIPMVVAMTMAAYTHYFGFFLSGALFLIDLAKCVCKRIKPKALMPYVVSWVLYLPWMYYILVIGNAAKVNYWQPKPTIASIPAFLKVLCGDVQNRYYLLLLGIIYLVLLFITAKRKHDSHDAPKWILLWIPLTLFTCVYLYGTYIAVGNTFWVWSYFIVAVPCFTVIIAAVTDGIYLLCADSQDGRNRIISLSLLIFVVFFSVDQACDKVKQWTKTSSEPFRETAAWINNHWDYMYDPNTIIVSASYSGDTQGMIAYYVTQKGKISKNDVNIADITQIKDEEILSKQRVILLRTVSVGGDLKARVDRLCEQLDSSYTQTEAINDRKIYIYERDNTGA